jgi:metal transporter CNNM
VAVIFGEIAPQSVCVRYGLPIGSWMAPFVLVLMYILAPIAWPTAKLLDYLLGEDHGTIYKKAGLKTLVSLHKSLGETGQQLNTDEVTIISAVLDLKDKSVGSIMTPMENVFTLSLDDVLDEETMDLLLSQGYSRIPIHHPDNYENFVGMLLVKMLITYDPEDAKPVREFALATLPETKPQTSCLDIVNFFQEGKSHMVLVSEDPGGDHGALGVVTLEDVIEELIGEEIIDESDVFIDVHKAIRRLAPAPRTRIGKPHAVTDSPATHGVAGNLIDIDDGTILSLQDVQRVKTADSVTKPKSPATTARRRSSATNSNLGDFRTSKRANTDDVRAHLKHLGPSNLASRPRSTRYNTVKIKPGSDAIGSAQPTSGPGRITSARQMSENASGFQSGIGDEWLLSGGKGASGGVQALQQQQTYGMVGASSTDQRLLSASKGVQGDPPELQDVDVAETGESTSQSRGRRSTTMTKRSESRSTVGSLRKFGNDHSPSSSFRVKGPTRSGSITENIVEANGIRKVVLETTSSSSNEEDENSGANKVSKRDENKTSNSGGQSQPTHVALRGVFTADIEVHDPSVAKKKKRRRKKHGHSKDEQQPLLGIGR